MTGNTPPPAQANAQQGAQPQPAPQPAAQQPAAAQPATAPQTATPWQRSTGVRPPRPAPAHQAPAQQPPAQQQQPAPQPAAAQQPPAQLRPRGAGGATPAPDFALWKARALQELGLASKATAQADLANDIRGIGARLFGGNGPRGHAQLASLRDPAYPDAKFDAYAAALAALEGDPARPANLRDQLRTAATAWLADAPAPTPMTARLNGRRKIACQQSLSDLRQHDICEQVSAIGAPPWNSAAAAQVASLRATLDFESLPIGEQTAFTNGKGGVNPSLWVKSAGANGQKQNSFIFKPQQANSEKAGEPVREALAGRAAELLNGALGFRVPMPETHVIAVDRERFAPETLRGLADELRQKDGPLVGSLQKVAAVTGDLKAQSRAEKNAVSVESTQQLAVLDLVTLNFDRHGGNLLTTGGNPPAIVPIDHGTTFPKAGDISKLREKMAGEHNALLALPGSHKPFTAEMQARIAGLDAETFADVLRREAAQVAQTSPSLAGEMDDTAVRASQLSIEFLKRAASRLTPAEVQIALGRNATELFDPKLSKADFARVADEVIAATKADGQGIAEYFLMPQVQRREVIKQLSANGWSDEIGWAGRFDRELFSDMTGVMALYNGNVKKPTAAPRAANPPKADPALVKAEFPNTNVNAAAVPAVWARYKAAHLVKADVLKRMQRSGAVKIDLARAEKDLLAFMEKYEKLVVLEQATAGRASPSVRNALARQLEFLDTLLPMLPANADPEIGQIASNVRQMLATVTRMGESRLADHLSLLRAKTDDAYDLVRARLRRIAEAERADGTIVAAEAELLVDMVNEDNLTTCYQELLKHDVRLGGQ